jgi:hypothetical protein
MNVSTASFNSGLQPLAITPYGPSQDAGSCASNPCNPYCVGIDVDAGDLQPEGGFTSTAVLGTVSDPTTFPAGIGGPKNAMGSSALSSPTRVACTAGPPYPPTDYKECSSDYCCAAYTVGTTPYTCQPWALNGADNPIAIANCALPTGVDFTIGLACQDSIGHVHVPVCNRGAGNGTSGTLMVAEYSGNPQSAGTSAVCQNPGSPSASCTINLATRPIPSGKCIDLDVNAANAGSVAGTSCPVLFSSGNRTMMVNPPSTAGYTTLTETEPCNNYGFHPSSAQGGTCSSYGSQPPPPAASSYIYNATCPAGSRAQWNQFAYDTSVPSESQVVFRVRTAPRNSDGGTGAFTAWVQVADVRSTSSPDPATCSISGTPTGCPKNLATLLGDPTSYNPVLEVDVNATATTAVPTVRGWQVTFNCVAIE